jgi:hypothetical protein
MVTAPIQPPVGGHLRTLRGLASYACAHAGSCCRAGWPIPIEPAPMLVLRAAEASGTLPSCQSGPWEIDGILGRTPDSLCIFHGTRGRPGCRLESGLGPTALPSSCRQFPRILLTDGRGWHQSISTWCPTAAKRVITGCADFLSIDHIEVDPRVHIESLDATGAWPPFLRPGVLAGHDVYEYWEGAALQRFLGEIACRQGTVTHMVASLLCWTDLLRNWRASEGSLRVLATRPWSHPPPARLLRKPATAQALRLLVLEPLLKKVDAAWRPAEWPAGVTDHRADDTILSRRDAEEALGRYLATRLIGSWITYQGEGLRSVAASLVSALVLITLALPHDQRVPVTLGHLTLAMRASDWLLLHLIDRQDWAEWCSDWERRPDASPLLELVAGSGALLQACVWEPLPREA